MTLDEKVWMLKIKVEGYFFITIRFLLLPDDVSVLVLLLSSCCYCLEPLPDLKKPRLRNEFIFSSIHSSANPSFLSIKHKKGQETLSQALTIFSLITTLAPFLGLPTSLMSSYTKRMFLVMALPLTKTTLNLSDDLGKHH